MGQALLFAGVALAVVGLIHYYLWRRLVRDTTVTPRARRVGTWTLIGLTALVLAAFLANRLLPAAVETVLAWPAYLWLAAMFYLLVILALLEVPRLIARRVIRVRAAAPEPALARVGAAGSAGTGSAGETAADPVPAPSPGQSRRLLLARAAAITAGLASAGLVASGVGSALGAPRINRVQIPLARLPRGADGLRIALVSDIHLGPLRGEGHTRRIVDLVNGLDADVVAVVGDLVDGTVAELGAAAAPLRELRSRLGAYFVTGNHEYFSGYAAWVEEVARLGLRPLRNERVELTGIDLAGVNDATGKSFGDPADYDRALADRDPARPVVLLAHQPIQAHEAARRGVDLQLSGHTHGGQMVPFDLVVRLSGQPIVSGLGEVDGMPVYVTNGAGFWGPPVRVGAPPDITLVQLHTP